LKGEGRERVKWCFAFFQIPLPLPPPTRGGENLGGVSHLGAKSPSLLGNCSLYQVDKRISSPFG